MHPVLSQLIQAFRSAQDLAVSTLRDRLGIPLPESNLAWAKSWPALGLPALGQNLGIPIRPHGYGLEMQFPSISIDFDWGDHGEAYGFDVWRLWNHCQANRLFLDSMTHDLLKLRFERACSGSELVGDRLLYYLPAERRKFSASVESAGVS